MKANDTSIRIYLEGSKQFAVPLFQRTYSWRRKHVQRLWNDIEETLNDPTDSHFFGSFVTLPIPSPASGVSKYIIIDGQQRLITTLLFLAALRDRIVELQPDYDKKEEIYELYLINKYHAGDKYKVVPTQSDKDVFFAVVEGSKPKTSDANRILDSFYFFEENISTISDLDTLINLKDTILLRFSVVDIRLDEGDDPYMIFESLNATGTPLTHADLIRNYLFMRIDQTKQRGVYDKVWLPMQEKLKDYLEDFIRHYLGMSGDIPAYHNIYSTFKNVTDKSAKKSEDVINKMKDLNKYSGYYNKFLHPKDESERSLRRQLENLYSIEITTSYPLLLNLYDDYANKKLSARQLVDCLKTIETYVVRRGVCGIPAQALNRYFPTLYRSINKEDPVSSLKEMLLKGKGSQRMPNDEEFRKCLAERSLYRTRILRYLLEQIENHENKEVVDFSGLQIEHVMPQTISNNWKATLGDNWEFVHQKYLDNLGNLTLTGYNPEYSNKSFIEKRNIANGFRRSRLRLNSDLARRKTWNEKEIRKRASRLSKIAVQIWSI